MTEQSGEQPSEPKEAPKEQPKDDGARFTQAQLNSFLANQKREIESRYEGFDDIKAKAAEFDKLEDEQKNAIDKANEAATSAAKERDTYKGEVDSLKVQLLRQKISATKGLDPDLWDRVRGGTEEEITADVEALVEKFTPAPKRSGAFRSGASAPDGATGKGRAAAALRGMRRD